MVMLKSVKVEPLSGRSLHWAVWGWKMAPLKRFAIVIYAHEVQQFLIRLETTRSATRVDSSSYEFTPQSELFVLYGGQTGRSFTFEYMTAIEGAH